MKRRHFFLFAFLLFLFWPRPIQASDTQDLVDELDFSKISSFLEKKEDVPVSFDEMVDAMLKGGDLPYETVGDYIKTLVSAELEEHRQLILLLLVVSLAFSVLKNYAKSFSSSYVSEICFFLCYCFMMVLLLQSFSVMNETVLNTTESMTEFIRLLIPVYCMAISFTLSINSSAAAYSLIFTAV